jgi:putative colanic acid biosynthesis acetyltransferase WcaF
VRAGWLIIEALVLLNPVVTSYRLKRAVLRAFGAQMGSDVTIKPGLHVKCPWRLEVGDHVWLGERAWIDNLANVQIGSNVCLSQGVYLCTGNHDWTDPGMGLVTAPITIEDGAWVAAFSRVGPGVTIGQDSVIALGAVIAEDAEPGQIYSGNPARAVGPRHIDDGRGPR